MLINSSIHNHSTFCDGKHSPEDMIASAYKAGFADFGVLCHATMTTGDYDWPIRDEAGFISDVNRLKKEYDGKMRIYCGLEKDYYGKVGTGFDYYIDAVHQICYEGRYFEVDHSKEVFTKGIEEGFGGDVKKYIRIYYDTVSAMIEREKPEYVAHIDLVTKFNDGYVFFNEEEKWYLDMAKNCISDAINADSLIEMNFGAMTRGVKSCPYPSIPLLKFIKEKKGRIIIGGDCHNANFVAFGMKEGEELLKEHGFKNVTIYRNGKYIEIGL